MYVVYVLPRLPYMFFINTIFVGRSSPKMESFHWHGSDILIFKYVFMSIFLKVLIALLNFSKTEEKLSISLFLAIKKIWQKIILFESI